MWFQILLPYYLNGWGKINPRAGNNFSRRQYHSIKILNISSNYILKSGLLNWLSHAMRTLESSWIKTFNGGWKYQFPSAVLEAILRPLRGLSLKFFCHDNLRGRLMDTDDPHWRIGVRDGRLFPEATCPNRGRLIPRDYPTLSWQPIKTRWIGGGSVPLPFDLFIGFAS